MNDPIYEYVKGQGWVAGLYVVTLKDGTVIRLEQRPPKKYEYYDSCSLTNNRFCRDGVVDMQAWMLAFKGVHNLDSFCFSSEDLREVTTATIVSYDPLDNHP